MCVGFWSLSHPEYPLILCSNRDEFLSRPTLPAQFHNFDHSVDNSERAVLSALDVRAGGTWLGINRVGNVALLTNITEPGGHYVTSRGHLVSKFLASDQVLEDYVKHLVDDGGIYAGFNLLLLEPAPVPTLAFHAFFVTNAGGGGPITARKLTEDELRCGGISNGVDTRTDKPWVKVSDGKNALSTVLQSAFSPEAIEVDIVQNLFDQVLCYRRCDNIIDRQQFKSHINITPIELPTADGGTDSYGTRTATVLLVRKDGTVLFVERDVWKRGEDGIIVHATQSDEPKQIERSYRFQLPMHVAVTDKSQTQK